MLMRLIATCTAFAMMLFAPGSHAATPQQTCIEVLSEFGLPTDGCAPAPSKTPTVKTLPPPPAAQLPGRITESHFFFPKGGANLDREAMVKLAKMIQILQAAPMSDACLRLVGHSDTSGSAEVNRDISQKRAQAVAEFLQRGLGNPARIQEIKAMGEDQPLENWPRTDRMNRRVAIWARKCP